MQNKYFCEGCVFFGKAIGGEDALIHECTNPLDPSSEHKVAALADDDACSNFKPKIYH